MAPVPLSPILLLVSSPTSSSSASSFSSSSSSLSSSSRSSCFYSSSSPSPSSSRFMNSTTSTSSCVHTPATCLGLTHSRVSHIDDCHVPRTLLSEKHGDVVNCRVSRLISAKFASPRDRPGRFFHVPRDVDALCYAYFQKFFKRRTTTPIKTAEALINSSRVMQIYYNWR